MPYTIDELKNKYFVQTTDVNPPSEPVPYEFDNSYVLPLVGGSEYFEQLSYVLDEIGTGASPDDNKGHLIYISNWQLDLLGYTLRYPLGLLGSTDVSTYAGTNGIFSLIHQVHQKNREIRMSPETKCFSIFSKTRHRKA